MNKEQYQQKLSELVTITPVPGRGGCFYVDPLTIFGGYPSANDKTSMRFVVEGLFNFHLDRLNLSDPFPLSGTTNYLFRIGRWCRNALYVAFSSNTAWDSGFLEGGKPVIADMKLIVKTSLRVGKEVIGPTHELNQSMRESANSWVAYDFVMCPWMTGLLYLQNDKQAPEVYFNDIHTLECFPEPINKPDMPHILWNAVAAGHALTVVRQLNETIKKRVEWEKYEQMTVSQEQP